MAVLVLVAAACSDRGDDPSGGEGASETTATSRATDATTADGTTFGDLASPCGEGDGAPQAPTGGPEETQGITDDAIAVGTVADPGFTARPGLNQEIFDAGEAFVGWCNEQGGINGRQLELTQYDAKYTEYQARMEEACGSEFAIVGDGAVQDNLWVSTGAACGLIDVAGFSVTPEKSGTSDPAEIDRLRAVQPLPNASDRYMVSPMRVLMEDHEDALAHFGIVYGDIATLQIQADKTVEAYEALGAEVVSQQAYNVIGEANWAPFAQELKNAGVEWFTFIGEGANLALLQQAMSEIDYSPEVTLQETNFYDQAYLDAAGDAAEGTYIRTAFVPFEEADQNPATRTYVDLVEGVDGKVALLGAQSMSAWLLFAQSAKACDDAGTLTRSCVLDEASSVTEWTGGGLHAASDPSLTVGTEDCTVLLQVRDGAFVRAAPDEGFECIGEPITLVGDYSTSG